MFVAGSILAGCKTTAPQETSTGTSTGVSTGTGEERRKLALLRATQVEVTRRLTQQRDLLLSMPKDSPLTREVSRQLAIINKQAGDVASEVFKAELALEAAIAEDLNIPMHKVNAGKGDAVSQFTLGWAYATGNGVQTDPEESVEWYRKAAEQNHVKSQFNLGMMYYNGTGVPKDLTFAYAWWKVAGSNGHDGSGINLEFISTSMSPEEIATALNLSKQILADIEQKKPTNPPCY